MKEKIKLLLSLYLCNDGGFERGWDLNTIFEWIYPSGRVVQTFTIRNSRSFNFEIKKSGFRYLKHFQYFKK